MITPYADGQGGQHSAIGDAHCRRFIGRVTFEYTGHLRESMVFRQCGLIEREFRLWWKCQKAGCVVQCLSSSIECCVTGAGGCCIRGLCGGECRIGRSKQSGIVLPNAIAVADCLQFTPFQKQRVVGMKFQVMAAMMQYAADADRVVPREPAVR